MLTHTLHDIAHSSLPDGLYVRVVLPEAGSSLSGLLAEGLGHGLRVGGHLAHRLQVRVLLADVRLALLAALLPRAVLVLERASDGARVGVLLADLQNPLGAPHGNVLANSTLNSGLIRSCNTETHF